MTHIHSKADPFLRNAWYCAAFSNEVGREPLGRRILNERIVLYRRQDGSPAALDDLCPHRFAPLHKGTITADSLTCRYHGLAFGPDGRCTRNPHDTHISPAIKVKSYPCAEYDNFIWIWMGDPSQSDLSLVPRYEAHTDKTRATVYGLLHVNGNYQLVSDNLLDLSHTQYLHPLLKRDNSVKQKVTMEENGFAVTAHNSIDGTPPSGFIRMLWPDAPQHVDMRGFMRWQAPGHLLQSINAYPCGEKTSTVSVLAAHIATPETLTTSHYFWSLSRINRRDDTDLDQKIQSNIAHVFTNEDAWMIGLIQQNIGDEGDILSLPKKPASLSVDRSAVRARIILKNMIRREQAAQAP